MKLKLFVYSLFVALQQCCCAQADSNLLAVGDWSAPVSDQIWPLRGRLVIYKPEYEPTAMKRTDFWPGAKVYVELQIVGRSNSAMGPAEIFIDRYLPMHFDLRDGRDKPITGTPGWRMFDGPALPQYTVTLPSDSTIRLRASTFVDTQNPDVLLIAVPQTAWEIPRRRGGDYFLSATFTPPTNHQSALKYHVWQGTLQLPKVRIPMEKLRN